MTDRELSEKLDELAGKIESLATELRTLANQKYTPSHTSWEDVKKQAKFPF